MSVNLKVLIPVVYPPAPAAFANDENYLVSITFEYGFLEGYPGGVSINSLSDSELYPRNCIWHLFQYLYQVYL